MGEDMPGPASGQLWLPPLSAQAVSDRLWDNAGREESRMTTTLKPQVPPVAQPGRVGRIWRWTLALVAAAGTIALVLILMGGSGGTSYAYELNGGFDEEGGAAPARPISDDGTFANDGYAFGWDGAMALDVDLGENYEIEMRVRIDDRNRWIKVLDFKDRSSDAGLYLYDAEQLKFWFAETCPDGVTDIVQGCRGYGTRWPLYGPDDAIELDQFVTIRFIRDGGEIEAYVNGELQTWSPAGQMHSRDTYPSDPTEAELEALTRINRFEDYKDQTLQSSPVLFVLADDLTTGESEIARGEIDYIRITTK